MDRISRNVCLKCKLLYIPTCCLSFLAKKKKKTCFLSIVSVLHLLGFVRGFSRTEYIYLQHPWTVVRAVVHSVCHAFNLPDWCRVSTFFFFFLRGKRVTCLNVQRTGFLSCLRWKSKSRTSICRGSYPSGKVTSRVVRRGDIVRTCSLCSEIIFSEKTFDQFIFNHDSTTNTMSDKWMYLTVF